MPETVLKSLESKFPDFFAQYGGSVVAVEEFRGDVSLVINPESLIGVLSFLKKDPSMRFEMLLDLFGMDYLKWHAETQERFAVIYELYSFSRNQHLRLKVFLAETHPEVASAISVFPCANWFERETWDLFGIQFKGHPNLIRILCHTDFEGHALRKDYPADQYQRLKDAAVSTEF